MFLIIKTRAKSECGFLGESACFMISNGAMKANRVGLSEYTARRLAELRARRAEADDTGGISIGASSSASAEDTVNDSDSSTVPPANAAANLATAPAYSKSASDSNTMEPVLPAAQLPSDSNLSSSSSASKSSSQSISAPTTAVSNGVSERSTDVTDVAAKHKQLWNDESESNALPAQRRIDRQDFSIPRAAAEPTKPPVQHREVSQPSPFTRSGFRSNDPTSAVEIGAVSRMVSFSCTMSKDATFKFFLTGNR